MSRRQRIAPSVILGPLLLSTIYSAGMAVAHLRSAEFAISQFDPEALVETFDKQPAAVPTGDPEAPGSLRTRVNYALDWVSGETDIGATVAITVTDSLGSVKDTASRNADGTGVFFVGCPNWDSGGCPDIVPGDHLYSATDSLGASVSPVGLISALMVADSDVITGTLEAPWFNEPALSVRCEIWENNGPSPIHTSADPNGGGFECDFSGEWDLQPGDQVAVLYYEPDGDHVINNPPWPWARVNYGWDRIGANYEVGHTFWITVTDDLGNLKAQATAESVSDGGWGGGGGFDSVEWSSERPDILPGDWVYFGADDGYTNTVEVGVISGTLNIDTDVVSGPILAPSFGISLTVECEPWGAWDAGMLDVETKQSWAEPDGSVPFSCQWDPNTEWDMQAGQDVAVSYVESDWDRVIDVYRDPAPYLRIRKWAEGNPAAGGNFVFHIGYDNLGDAPAESVVITDTMPVGLEYLSDTSGFSQVLTGTDAVVWDVGTLDPDVGREFDLYAQVTAATWDFITNTVEIATSTPHDQGDPGQKSFEWVGQVLENDTHLSVGKSAWIDDPAPGQDFVFAVNVCNHGSTASTEVTLEDSLHPSLNLVDWWAQHPGWYEVDRDPSSLVVAIPSIAANSCSEIFLRVNLDAQVAPGGYIDNTAVIACDNDLEIDDNTALWEGFANEPHVNLAIHKSFVSGSLVPGGWVRYGIAYRNTGNMPVGTAWITDTFPVDTTFVGAWYDNPFGSFDFPPQEVTPDYAVWQVPEVDAGYGGSFEVLLNIDSNANPGSLLLNSAMLGPLPGEDTHEDNISISKEILGSPGANLRVQKSHSWQENSQLQYEVRFDNLGDETVSSVVITDTLPQMTNWNGSWDMDFDWERLVDFQGSASQLAWQFTDLQPGESGRLHFNADLDEPGVPVRWYTNTVEITFPSGETNPGDNSYEDVAFSGGEVHRVELWINEVGDSHLWGEAVASSVVTVTTPVKQVTAWADPDCGGCWEMFEAGPLQPGDLVEVVAGDSILPVELAIPDPFDAKVDTDTDEVFGQIGGWESRPVEIHGGWPEGYREVVSNPDGGFLASYPDIPRGGSGHVRIMDQVSYADVVFHKPFLSLDLVLDINYGLDVVEGFYELGHSIWITVTESNGSTVKGTAELATDFIPAWNNTGFSTGEQGWTSARPDLQPGDWVFGTVDNGYESSARLGSIDFSVDYVSDVITGTVQAGWIAEPVLLRCEIRGSEESPWIDLPSVDPNGGGFECDFGAIGWNIEPDQMVAVRYREPDADWVATTFPDLSDTSIAIGKLTNGIDAKDPPGPFILVGDPVQWTYVVTNTGSITLTSIHIADDMGVEVSCNQTTLGPDESFACDGSGAATLGQYENTATVTGMTPFDFEVLAEDVSHYYGVVPDVAIKKLTNGEDADSAPGPFIPVGTSVTWTYVITNSGNVALVDVVVTDSELGFVCDENVLGSGQVMICEANGTAAEGQYANEGTVSGSPPVGQQVVAMDWSHYFGTVASVEIGKATNGEDADLPPGPFISVGDPVIWTYAITNTGNVTLTNVVVTDSELGAIATCPRDELGVGETMQCEASGTAATGQYTNIGFVEGAPPVGSKATDSDTSHYFGLGPVVNLATRLNGEVAAEPPGPLIEAGDWITWTHTVTNTGNVTVTQILVSDEVSLDLGCPGDVLGVGEAMACEGSSEVTSSGQISNTATVQGVAIGTSATVSDTAVSFYFGGGIDLEKLTNGVDADEPPGPLITVGDTVTWNYVITNTSYITLTGVAVIDDQGVTVDCPGTELGVGSGMTCVGSAPSVVVGLYRNEAEVEAWTEGVEQRVSDRDVSHYTGTESPIAAIEIQKWTNGEDADVPPGPTIAPGQPVTWTYRIANTGTVDLFDFEVTDDVEGGVCTQPGLAPTDSFVCTLEGIAIGGPYENMGTVVAWTATSGKITDSDPSHYYGDKTIFEDGFETGDLSRWSRTVGEELIFEDGFQPGDLSRWTRYWR